MRKIISLFIAIIILLGIVHINIFAEGNVQNENIEMFSMPQDAKYAENEVLIQYSPVGMFADESDVSPELMMSENLESVSSVELIDTLSVDKEDGSILKQLHVETEDLEKTINEMRQIPGVEYVEPNYKLYVANTDYDPNFTKQWAYNNPVYNINVENVWEKVYNDNISKTETIVAVLDTGVDIYHEDLKDNIFKNQEEIYGNTEKDDDNNGFVDDIAGWDFLNNDNTVYDNTTDSTGEKTDSHGTHVAGIIAAAKNGVGMQGVAYENVKILPVKFIAGKEGGDLSDAIKGIKYAEKMGASIVNCSFASNNEFLTLKDVMRRSKMLFVCAAGNHGTQLKEYPAGFADLDNVISVCALNQEGDLTSFSNYGHDYIAAPGKAIYSLAPENNYMYMDGTSMSTPFVAGAAALLKIINPSLDSKQLKDALNNGSKTSETGLFHGKLDILGAYENSPLNPDEGTLVAGIKEYGGKIINHDNSIYRLAGCDESGFMNNIAVYKPDLGVWSDVTYLREGRIFAAPVFIDSTIRLCGGRSILKKDLDTTWTYNIHSYFNNTIKTNTGSYYIYANRSAAAGVGAEGKVYFFGGTSDGRYANDVLSAKPTSSSDFRCLMPESRGYACAEYLNGDIYLFGGANENGCLTSTYKYDISENSIKECAPTNYYHNNAASAVIDGKIYVFGGTNQYTKDGHDPITENNGIISDVPNNIVEVYDPNTNIWTRIADMDAARVGHSAVFYKNKTILMGGWNGEYLDSVEYYWGSEAPKNVKSALSIDMQSTMLSWQPVTGADSYEIQIGDREPIFTAETKVNYLISEPNDENFKVRAIKNGGVSVWSSERKLYPLGTNINDAIKLTLNVPVSDILKSNENSKYYKFEIDSLTNIDIKLFGIPQNFDGGFEILDEYGLHIASGYSKNGNIMIENRLMTTGDYIIRVYNVPSDGSDLNYTLEVSEYYTEETGNLPTRVSQNMLNSVDMSVSNTNYTIIDDGTLPDNSMSIEMEEDNSGEFGINNTTTVYSGTGVLNKNVLSRVFTIKNVKRGSLIIAVVEPPSGYAYVPYFISNNLDSSVGCLDPYNNTNNIASSSFLAKSDGSYSIRVVCSNGEYDPQGGEFKIKAFVTTDPEKFESNQWQMGANDKEYGDKSAVNFNKIEQAIGTTNKPTSGIDAKFSTTSDIDTYPIEVSQGEKISVSLEVDKSEYVGSYTISFQTNFKDFNYRDNPDGVSKDFNITYERTDCTNPYNVKAYNNSAFASWIVPNNLVSNTAYIVVQKNKKSMDIGSEVGYHLIITRVSPEEMKKDVNENSTYTPSGKKALNGDAETSAVTPITRRNDFINFKNNKNSAGKLTQQVSGTGVIDSQLDVDWFHYEGTVNTPNRVVLTTEADNLKLALYENGSTRELENGDTVNFKTSDYYIGVYAEDETYGQNQATDYILSVIDDSKEKQDVHIVLYDSGYGGNGFYDGQIPRYYDSSGNKFEYSVEFFKKYLPLLVNKDVYFSVSIRDLDFDRVFLPVNNIGDLRNDPFIFDNYDNLSGSGELELVKNLTIDRVNNVYDNMIAAYRSLPNYQKPKTMPKIYIGTPHYTGWQIRNWDGTNIDNYVLKYDEIVRNIYEGVRSHVIAKSGSDNDIAGLYYGKEDPEPYNTSFEYTKIMRNTSSMIHGESKKMIWMPYTGGSITSVNNVCNIANTYNYDGKKLCDVIVIQPGYFYYEVSNDGRSDSEYPEFMQYIRDIVFNNDKNSGTDLCFQMEYDSSIFTGRYINDESKSNPSNKTYRFAKTLDIFKYLLTTPEYSFGIYAGGPNEQGYNMNKISDNINLHSNRNHITLYENDGHYKTYKDLTDIASNYNMAYNTKITYDITAGLLFNGWSSQVRDNIHRVYNELFEESRVTLY